MKIEQIATDKLIPYARNAKRHDAAQVSKLAGSIREFGFNNPVLIDKDNGIVAGHGRVMAAQKLELKTVPCIRLGHLTDTQRRAYILADNRLAEVNSGWDEELLKLEIKDIDWGELKEIGIDDFEFGKIDFGEEKKEPESDADAEPQIDKAEELRAKWGVEPGQLWELGDHRLLCGDSTKAEDVARVMDGEKDAVAIIDPPYGVSVVGKAGKVGGDNAAKCGVYSPVIGDESTDTARKCYEACLAFGFFHVGVWGGNYFTEFLPPSPCWFVWDKRGDMASNNFADCELMWTNLNTPSRVFKQTWCGMIREGESDKRVHPTQKPIQTVQQAIQLFGEATVFDGFLGSGTTLIACEQLGRKCRAIEISPAYVAVAIQRWADATGKTPRKL
jgi:hypothetical protein